GGEGGGGGGGGVRRGGGGARSGVLEVHVRRRQPIDQDLPGRAAIGPAVRADPHADAVLERRIEIAVEQIRRFHDVHVGVDEPKSILHGVLLVERVDTGLTAFAIGTAQL